MNTTFACPDPEPEPAQLTITSRSGGTTTNHPSRPGTTGHVRVVWS